MLSARFPDLGDDLVPVRNEDTDTAFDLAQVGTQVVLQVLDADPLDSLHEDMVATSSYYVKLKWRRLGVAEAGREAKN